MNEFMLTIDSVIGGKDEVFVKKDKLVPSENVVCVLHDVVLLRDLVEVDAEPVAHLRGHVPVNGEALGLAADKRQQI